MRRRQPRSRVKVKAEALWEQLHRRHMAQRELADLLGMSPGYLSQVLSGRRSPSASRRRRMQEALGVDDFDELFYVERDGDG